jgi:hypothetical protein
MAVVDNADGRVAQSVYYQISPVYHVSQSTAYARHSFEDLVDQATQHPVRISNLTVDIFFHYSPHLRR